MLQQASTTREAERYKIHPAKPGPPEKKKRKKGKGLEESRLTHTKNARRGRAARDQPELNLELLGQSRRRKKFSFRDSFESDGYNYFGGYRGFSPLAFQGLLA